MIRKIDSHTCQILHRRTTHVRMLEIISEIHQWGEEILKEILDIILLKDEYSLSELASILPQHSNAKIIMLLLIHTEYSYYKGSYRKKQGAAEDATEALAHVNTAILEYLEIA